MAGTKHQFSELSYTLTEMKAFIAAIRGNPQGTNSSEANKGYEAAVSWDVGNAFGICASKRTKTWLASPPALALTRLMMLINLHR